MKKLSSLIALFFATSLSYASNFTAHNIHFQMDANNPGRLSFETMDINQKTYLLLSTSKLNTAFLSVINSDSLRKRIATNISLNNFDVVVSSGVSTNCDGSDVLTTDTSCTSRKCTVKQKVISACNESDCWKLSSTTDRTLIAEVSEHFDLRDKVEITECILNNSAGQKNSLSFTVTDPSTGVHAGASVQATVLLLNDNSKRH